MKARTNLFLKAGAILLCLLSVPLFSQKPAIVFDHFGYAQGFTSRSSRGVVKAYNGFIYISTEQGLARYDGHQFTYFTNDPADSTSIADNYLKNICEDQHHRLWIISGNDLNVFDLESEKTKRLYRTDTTIPDKHFHPSSFLYDAAQDKLWIGTEHGLFWNQGNEISIHPYTFADGTANNLSIHTLVEEDPDQIWLGTPAELYHLNLQRHQLTPIPLEEKSDPPQKMVGFVSSYITSDHMLWLGTWTQGLVKYNIRTSQFDNFLFTGPGEQNGVLAIHQSELPQEANLLWMGTTKGLMTFDRNSGKFTPYIAEHSNDMYGVPASVWDFYNARPEGMWIASHNGLHRYDYNKQIFKEVYFPNPKNEVRTFRVVNFSLEKSDQDIAWMIVPDMGNFRYKLSDNTLSPFPKSLQEIVSDDTGIFNSFIDGQNVFWLSTNDKGLIGYAIDSNSLVCPPNSFFQQNWVYCFLEYKDVLYVGTRKGLYQYDRQKGNFEEISIVSELIEANHLTPSVHDIEVDQQGQLWLKLGHSPAQTANGILAYNVQTKAMKFITVSTNRTLGSLRVLHDIHVGSDQEMYISSLNGIAHFDTRGDFSDIGLYTTKHGMISNSVLDLVEDDSGNMWCSGNFGIICFNLKSKTFRNFSQSTTSLGKSEFPPLYFDSNTHSLYAFQNNYFNVLRPADLTYYPSNVSITTLQINHEEKDHHNRNWILPYDQNQIYISFSLLSYTNSSENIYTYVLDDGVHTTKTETKENYARFDNLAPGHYAFTVKGINGFGIKSENEERIDFQIKPPFTQSIWFLLSISLLVFAALFSFFKYREMQAGKMHKLRLSIARDLHDEMGSTLSNILMMSELDLLKSGANRNTTLDKVVVKIREVMDSMSDIVWSINPKHDQLEDVIIKLQNEAIEVLEPMDITLKFDIQPISAKVAFSINERRDLYLLFKEAIHNIARHADAKYVTFTFISAHKKYRLSLEDDGKGFSTEETYNGNGLKNMRSRAEKLGCIIYFQSKPGSTKILLEKQ